MSEYESFDFEIAVKMLDTDIYKIKNKIYKNELKQKKLLERKFKNNINKINNNNSKSKKLKEDEINTLKINHYFNIAKLGNNTKIKMQKQNGIRDDKLDRIKIDHDID